MIELSVFGQHRLTSVLVILCLLYHNLNLSWSLNDEGFALLRFRERVVSDPFGALSNWKDDVRIIDPCSWFGVECADGNVVVLNLKDLCLEGTLAPGLGNLVHIKSIILRNNSFHGIIPEEIGKLQELEVLDLGYNNFSGPLPSDLGNNLSLAILLLDNNNLSGSISPEIHELKMISEGQVDENHLSNAAQKSSGSERSSSWSISQSGYAARRSLRQLPPPPINLPEGKAPPHPVLAPSLSSSPSPLPSPSPSPSPSQSPSPSSSPSASPSPSPSPSHSPTPSPPRSIVPKAKLISPSPATPPSPPSLSTPSPSTAETSHTNNHRILMLSVAIGGPVLLFALLIGIFFCKGNKVAAIRPWATGLSGQLQKALVNGVPKLKRSELEIACEDFSNVIASSSAGTMYKGTLSNGVEIAVSSVVVASAKDWSKILEAQFRDKIDKLSKVNHKNFVNLIGYCEEDEPFTRMLVFEYAPNGTLFEHLHIKEAEHLDWGMRMRITMGIAYCLEYMHQLTPPTAHKNLNSSAIYLTEDYAAKVSDFGFWSDIAAAEMRSNPESNIYSFGVILFEMVTGRLPYAVDGGSLDDWASDYLRGEQRPFREKVDPTLNSFQVEQLEKIGEVIRSCVHPDPKQRPQMREVTARLQEITTIGPDGAVPKLSPLWWAELEILSTEAS